MIFLSASPALAQPDTPDIIDLLSKTLTNMDALAETQNRNERQQRARLLTTVDPQKAKPVKTTGKTTADAALKTGELRQAMTGERFAYRGQFREGTAATEFAAGYIFALAERSAQHGGWCGFKYLLPHELFTRVFDSLPTPGPSDHGADQSGTRNATSDTERAAQDTTAAEHIVSFLEARFPCNTQQQAEH